MDQSTIFVRSEKFPVLDGEDREIVNPGTFGRSFAEYIQNELRKHDYRVPSVVCEDFGWWVEVKLPSGSEGIGCVRSHSNEGMAEFYVSTAFRERKWSWRRFKMVDISHETEELREALRDIFSGDPDIEVLPDDFKGCFDYFGTDTN